MTGLQQIGRTQLLPLETIDIQHLAQLFARERQERLEGDGQIGCQLQAKVENRCHTVGSLRATLTFHF